MENIKQASKLFIQSMLLKLSLTNKTTIGLKHRHFNYLRSLDAIRSLEFDEITEEEEVT